MGLVFILDILARPIKGINKMPLPLVGFDPQYCYTIQWMFETDTQPTPHLENHDTIELASAHLLSLLPHIKELVLVSVTRRIK